MSKPTILRRTLAGALGVAACLSVAHAEIPRIMVVTSDPQYPWTPATDEGEHSDKADAALAEALIREQYESIAAFRREHPGQHIPVIVNGDITSQSKRSEQQKMSELLGILGDEVYYGLGNHDYQNNLTNHVCQVLYCAMEALDNLALHVQGHRRQGRVLDFDFRTYGAGLGGIEKEGSWSYAFVPDGWKRVVNIQLNNFPTYAASINWGVGPYSYHYRVESSVPWLEQKLPSYDDPRQNDFILLHLHQPNDVVMSAFDEPTPLRQLLGRHRVAAAFAGHYHDGMGRYWRGHGGIPVFLSGSASQRTYLIVEHWPASKKLKVYGVRNNRPADRELLQEIDV